MAEIKELENLETMPEVEGEDLKDSRVYEVGCHFSPVLSTEKLAENVSLLKKQIEDAGCPVISEGAFKKITLAYPISKKIGSESTDYDQAYFGWIKFEGSPEFASILEAYLKGQDNVLRFLIIKTVKEDTYIDPTTLGTEEAEAPKEVIDTGEPAVSKSSEKEKKGDADEEDIDKSIEELVVE